MCNDVKIFDVIVLLREGGQFVEVGGEDAKGVNFGCDMSNVVSPVSFYTPGRKLGALTLRWPKPDRTRHRWKCHDPIRR